MKQIDSALPGYDPKKLFSVDIRCKDEHYLTFDPLITLNTKNKNLSINKRAKKDLGILGKVKARVRFLCDGFKLYIDSMVEEGDKNSLFVSNANVGNSKALCEELKKHYEIQDNYRAFFKLTKVEKYRFRLDLQSVKLLK